MKVVFRTSFARDLSKLRDKRMSTSIKDIIEQVEQAGSLVDIGDIKKLRGDTGYYRIRVGDYRLGLLVEDDCVIFVRFLHRKDIYRYFP